MIDTKEKTFTAQRLSENAQILSVHAGMDSTTWRLGLFETLEDPCVMQALTKLCDDLLLPNVFFEPPYVNASTKHFTKGETQYLFLTRQTGEEETLQFFMPVKVAKLSFQRHYAIQSCTHDYANLGMPLVCAKDVTETLSAFTECIKIAKHEKAKAIVINYLPIEGAFIKSLYTSKGMSDRILLAKGIMRAGLKPMIKTDYTSKHLSGSTKQNLKKATRQLEEMGELKYDKISNCEEIKNVIDEFLELEESGWKGQKQTALNQKPETQMLTKQATYKMAEKGKCFIYTLRLDGKLLSSLIVFMSQGRYHTWKIAFNEAYARYSVGNLLSVYATADFSQSEDFKGLDSLAADFNQTALRFWPDEKEFFSMVIGLGENPTKTTLQISRNLNRIWYMKNILRNIIFMRSR